MIVVSDTIITQCQCQSKRTKDHFISSHRPATIILTWIISRKSHSGSGEFPKLIFLVKGPARYKATTVQNCWQRSLRDQSPVGSHGIRGNNTPHNLCLLDHLNNLVATRSRHHSTDKGAVNLSSWFGGGRQVRLPLPWKQRCLPE